ncbi:MAG: hypothetical protein M3R13_07660 [Armatimonadota bacterium]|nr:hypothetical protein [Armatimonadota bacterium]
MKLSLTIVALIGLALFAVFLSYPRGNTKERAKQTATIVNARALTRAFLLYVPDSKGKIPTSWRTGEDLRRLLSPDVDARSFETYNPNGGEFIPNAKIEGKSLADLGPPETVIVLMESKPWPDGKRPVGYADGHVKRHDSSEISEFEIGQYWSMPRILATLLESCDARSPFREYNFKQAPRDTIDVLLTVASADLDHVQEAAAIFLQGSSSNRDRIGREDLLELLLGLMVDYPERQVHITVNVLVNRAGKLTIERDWPSHRMGWWKPRDFKKDLSEGIRLHGRRDLTEFIANHDD